MIASNWPGAPVNSFRIWFASSITAIKSLTPKPKLIVMLYIALLLAHEKRTRKHRIRKNKNERRLPATWETRHPHSASRGCIVLAGGGLDTCAASSVLIIQLRRYWMKRVEVCRIAVSAVLILSSFNSHARNRSRNLLLRHTRDILMRHT